MTQNEQKRVHGGLKFAFGGISAMTATCFTHPLDLVKNRMQVAVSREHTTSLSVLKHIVKTEGASAVYSGLTAGLLRQGTYATTRLGIYTYLFEKYAGPDGAPPGFLTKAGCSMVAGLSGAFVGTPAELVLIRMTADGRLPKAEQRNYRNAFQALYRISHEEGTRVLWRGVVPTMGRAVVVNIAQLTSYSQAKQSLFQTGYFGDNIFLHFCSSMISGLVTTVTSMPVDIAKTRIQNMKVVDGKAEYKGAIDVMMKVAKNEGVSSLWKGFTPYYLRVGPHTVLTFIFLEQINKAYRTHVLHDTSGKGSAL